MAKNTTQVITLTQKIVNFRNYIFYYYSHSKIISFIVEEFARTFVILFPNLKNIQKII